MNEAEAIATTTSPLLTLHSHVEIVRHNRHSHHRSCPNCVSHWATHPHTTATSCHWAEYGWSSRMSCSIM